MLSQTISSAAGFGHCPLNSGRSCLDHGPAAKQLMLMCTSTTCLIHRMMFGIDLTAGAVQQRLPLSPMRALPARPRAPPYGAALRSGRGVRGWIRPQPDRLTWGRVVGDSV